MKKSLYKKFKTTFSAGFLLVLVLSCIFGNVVFAATETETKEEPNSVLTTYDAGTDVDGNVITHGNGNIVYIQKGIHAHIGESIIENSLMDILQSVKIFFNKDVDNGEIGYKKINEKDLYKQLPEGKALAAIELVYSGVSTEEIGYEMVFRLKESDVNKYDKLVAYAFKKGDPTTGKDERVLGANDVVLTKIGTDGLGGVLYKVTVGGFDQIALAGVTEEVKENTTSNNTSSTSDKNSSSTNEEDGIDWTVFGIALAALAVIIIAFAVFKKRKGANDDMYNP